MGSPFKMKGSPMQRNFGVGSPLHQKKKTWHEKNYYSPVDNEGFSPEGYSYKSRNVLQKAWDKYGPVINQKVKTEKAEYIGFDKGQTVQIKSSFGKSKKYKYKKP